MRTSLNSAPASEPGRETREDRADQPDRPQVAVDRIRDVRLLNLHRNVLAVAGVRAVDLTEGGDREWLLVEGSEYILHASLEILLDHSSHSAERKRIPGVRADRFTSANRCRWRRPRRGASGTDEQQQPVPLFIPAQESSHERVKGV